MTRWPLVISMLILAGLATGCGGGPATPATPPPPAPTVTIGGTTATPATGPVTVTFTFSQPMAAFPAGDVQVTGANPAAATTMVDATHFTLVLTPPAGFAGSAQITVGAGTFTDAAGVANLTGATASQPFNTVPGGPVLTWSDEFDGPDGSLPDPAKWAFDTGGGGWGNGELESYTARAQNAQIQGGNLVITARRETYTGADGITCDYTSARLKTLGLFSQAYGRFEARIRIPAGQGMWPAFWMLGNDFPTAGWPACGEVDIMENIGIQPATLYGSIHGPGFIGGNLSTTINLPTGALADDFHIYAVEWQAGEIDLYLDSTLYAAYTPASLPPGSTWVFDQPFFLILNVAVGGGWPGPPDASTVFPQTMLVDYVRVYSQ